MPEGQGQDVEDPEKEQYAQALEAQGVVEAYLIAYAAILADRKGELQPRIAYTDSQNSSWRTKEICWPSTMVERKRNEPPKRRRWLGKLQLRI